MNTKVEEALKVSEDILNSFEDHTQKISNVLLKCLKLARLMEDDVESWSQASTTCRK